MAAEQEERRREAEKEKVEKRREAEEKKRKQAHLKRLLSQDARDEKLEAIEKKRKKHGEDLDRWSATLLKASGGRSASLWTCAKRSRPFYESTRQYASVSDKQAGQTARQPDKQTSARSNSGTTGASGLTAAARGSSWRHAAESCP